MRDFSIKRVAKNKYICEADDYKCGKNARWKITDNVLHEDYWYCQGHMRSLFPHIWDKAKAEGRT